MAVKSPYHAQHSMVRSFSHTLVSRFFHHKVSTFLLYPVSRFLHPCVSLWVQVRVLQPVGFPTERVTLGMVQDPVQHRSGKYRIPLSIPGDSEPSFRKPVPPEQRYSRTRIFNHRKIPYTLVKKIDIADALDKTRDSTLSFFPITGLLIEGLNSFKPISVSIHITLSLSASDIARNTSLVIGTFSRLIIIQFSSVS